MLTAQARGSAQNLRRLQNTPALWTSGSAIVKKSSPYRRYVSSNRYYERRIRHDQLIRPSFLTNPVSDGQQITTLAIETSCDDTSVAVLSLRRAEGPGAHWRSHVLFHERITANSNEYQGIHPLVALQSHQTELGSLVEKAMKVLRPNYEWPKRKVRGNGSWAYLRKPDFVTVTRGPGMLSNLSVGLNVAKGLAAAWNVPLLGVHHMQAHALTPRLCSTLRSKKKTTDILHQPSFND